MQEGHYNGLYQGYRKGYYMDHHKGAIGFIRDFPFQGAIGFFVRGCYQGSKWVLLLLGQEFRPLPTGRTLHVDTCMHSCRYVCMSVCK